MKAILALVVLIGIGIFLAFKYGGVGSFDPEEQAKQFNVTVKPGMTWQQVMEKYPPKKLAVYGRDDRGLKRRSNEDKFVKADFEAAVKAASFPDGFDFCYFFSGEHAYAVRFNAAGAVEEITKATSLGDLMKIGVSTN